MPIISKAHAQRLQGLEDIDWGDWAPVDCATLCFVRQGSEVLLIRKKRGLGAGKINAPGGRLDEGESFEQAAIREVHEEVGLKVTNLAYAGQHFFSLPTATACMCRSSRRGFSGTPPKRMRPFPFGFQRYSIR